VDDVIKLRLKVLAGSADLQPVGAEHWSSPGVMIACPTIHPGYLECHTWCIATFDPGNDPDTGINFSEDYLLAIAVHTNSHTELRPSATLI